MEPWVIIFIKDTTCVDYTVFLDDAFGKKEVKLIAQAKRRRLDFDDAVVLDHETIGNIWAEMVHKGKL